MEIYDSLLGAVCDEYDRVTLIKKSERGEVTLIRPVSYTHLDVYKRQIM